jgi:DNA-binding MarR family transcriptional regulator
VDDADVRVRLREVAPHLPRRGLEIFGQQPEEFLQRLWACNHAVEQLSGSMVARLGVTAQQRQMLRCIGKFPGIPAGQLAELLRVDPGTISAALRRLEAKGLVDRRRDPRDHRRTALGLTARGRELDRAMPGTVEHAVDGVLATSTDAELATTARVLDRLIASLHAELPGAD